MAGKNRPGRPGPSADVIKAAVERYAGGTETLIQVAAAVGVHYSTVWRWVKAAGRVAPRPPGQPPGKGWNADPTTRARAACRRAAARARRLAGQTLGQIGAALGVTRERARQLTKDVDVPALGPQTCPHCQRVYMPTKSTKRPVTCGAEACRVARQTAIRRADRAAADRAAAGPPPRFAAVAAKYERLVSMWEAGRSLIEIAAALGTTPGTIGSTLPRLRRPGSPFHTRLLAVGDRRLKRADNQGACDGTGAGRLRPAEGGGGGPGVGGPEG